MSSRSTHHAGCEPKAPKLVPEPGYHRWYAGEIAAGEADIDAGRVTPADEVWSEHGID